jgi:hypothetical protein
MSSHASRARWTNSLCDAHSVTWSHSATLLCRPLLVLELSWCSRHCTLASGITVPIPCPWIAADSTLLLRKPPPPRAWQGTNPITQRPTNPTSNGVASAPRPSQNAGAFSGETASPMRHLNDRMMFLLANLSVSKESASGQHRC